jgi:hypothetical protein
MSAQRLSAKKLRKIQRAVGDAAVVLRGWSHGGYVFPFVTTDHHHGYYDLKTATVEWAESGKRFTCYTSCDELPTFQAGPPQ